MLIAGRNVYVLFCCQQAIEKALKAHIEEHGDELPYIHSLIKLRQLAMSAESFPFEDDFLREVSAYYIQSRYLAEMIYLTEYWGKLEIQETYTKSKEIVEWLMTNLK